MLKIKNYEFIIFKFQLANSKFQKLSRPKQDSYIQLQVGVCVWYADPAGRLVR